MIPLTVEEALAIVDTILAPERLSSVQELVFRDCWAGQTYQDIAQRSGYDGDYVRVIGSRLWQLLSEATGEKITKNNIHVALRQYCTDGSRLNPSPPIAKQDKPAQMAQKPLPEFPGGPRPLTCPYYIECPSIAADCDRELRKPGGLIRIKAPEKRGKSSLILRLLSHAESQGYAIVRLNLQQVEGAVLNNLDRFLRWFCANVAQQLKLESKLDAVWDSDLGSKISSTLYLQGQVLSQLQRPCIIALDELHRLFDYPAIAQDFLPLLRLWHEEANNLEDWTKLRLIVAYSTEVYISLKLNQSPFNVGLPIRLPKFTFDQTQTLALRYGLTVMDEMGVKDLRDLHTMVDGHPYLLNLAFYALSSGLSLGAISIQEFLHNAPTQTGIYSEHLRSLLTILQNVPTLSSAFREVLIALEAVPLDPILAYQLERMGLVNLDGDRATPSCDLYRLYFHDRLT